MTSKEHSSLPHVSRFLFWGFSRYSQRLVRRRFSSLQIADNEHFRKVTERSSNRSVLCYINHVGWWDPLTAVVLTQRLFPDRQFYAPIDADALEQYAVLKKLGFFPIQRDSVSGTRNFLETMDSVLRCHKAATWMTPEGRFCDVRQPAELQKGLGQAVARYQKQATEESGSAPIIQSAAIEYCFWDESTPELLVEFGASEMIDAAQEIRSGEEWTVVFQEHLRNAQASLAKKAIARDPSAFHTATDGTAGEGGVYDWARRLKSLFSGKKFDARHSRNDVN